MNEPIQRIERCTLLCCLTTLLADKTYRSSNNKIDKMADTRSGTLCFDSVVFFRVDISDKNAIVQNWWKR